MHRPGGVRPDEAGFDGIFSRGKNEVAARRHIKLHHALAALATHPAAQDHRLALDGQRLRIEPCTEQQVIHGMAEEEVVRLQEVGTGAADG